MSINLKELCQQAAALTDTDKLVLVDTLLAQLDRPDPELNQIWAEEVRKRRFPIVLSKVLKSCIFSNNPQRFFPERIDNFWEFK